MQPLTPETWNELEQDGHATSAAQEYDMDSIEGVLEWALDQLNWYMSRVEAPHNAMWNDYRHAKSILHGTSPDQHEEKP